MHVDDHVVVGAARVGDEGHGVAGEGLDGDLGGGGKTGRRLAVLAMVS